MHSTPAPSNPEANSIHDPPALLSVTEFHSRFKPHIGINSIYDLIRSGRIRSIRVGERKRLIPSTELTDWPMRELDLA